jgi:hypothetical protein
MAVWSIVDFQEIGLDFILAAEHYHSAKLAALARLNSLPGFTIAELFTEVQDIITPGTAESPARLYDLTDALGGFLRSGTDLLEADFLSNRKLAQPGDIIVSRLRSYLQEIAVIPSLGHTILVSPEFIVLRPRVSNRIFGGAWLLPYLLSEPVQTILQWSQTGSAHPRFNSETLMAIRVPETVLQIAQELSDAVQEAHDVIPVGRQYYAKAETLLLHTLHLDKLAVASKTYTASFSDFTRTLRLDAQYYQPRYQQTLDRLGKSGLTVANVAVPVRTRFRPVAGTTFQYLEIGGLLDGGRVEPEPVAAEDAPSRAQTVLQVGDVVTSSVRPIRRLTGFIGPEQGGTVGTSGFIALRPTAVAPEVLTVYLRLPIVCEILDLYTTATMYPTITEADVLKLPFPALSPEVQREIVSLVQAGFAARQRATELLDEAKRRVEQFIKAA